MAKIWHGFALICVMIEMCQALQLDIEKLQVCKNNRTYSVRFNELSVSSRHNVVNSRGSGNITKELGKTGITMHIEFKPCPTDKTCRKSQHIEINSFCNLLTTKSVMGPAFGTYTTPHMKCPIQPGTYKFNVSVDMRKLLKIPGRQVRSLINVKLVDKISKNEQSEFICFEIVSSFK